jgi:hypothetical protein
MGERVWLDRRRVPIPSHHARAAAVLSAIAGWGFIPAVIGAFLNEPVVTVAGGVTALMAPRCGSVTAWSGSSRT